MQRKLNREDVMRRLTALGIKPKNQAFVLRRLGLEVPAYQEGGQLPPPPAADGSAAGLSGVDPSASSDTGLAQAGSADSAPPSVSSPLPSAGMKSATAVEHSLAQPPAMRPLDSEETPRESDLTRWARVPGFFFHYLDRSGTYRRVPFDSAYSKALTLREFELVKAILSQGIPGRYPIEATQSIETQGPEHWYLGYLDHNLSGQLVIHPDGRYSFEGNLWLGPDLYNMNKSIHRKSKEEWATSAGRTIGEGRSKPFDVYVTGIRRFSESGFVPLRPTSNASMP